MVICKPANRLRKAPGSVLAQPSVPEEVDRMFSPTESVREPRPKTASALFHGVCFGSSHHSALYTAPQNSAFRSLIGPRPGIGKDRMAMTAAKDRRPACRPRLPLCPLNG